MANIKKLSDEVYEILDESNATKSVVDLRILRQILIAEQNELTELEQDIKMIEGLIKELQSQK